MKTKKNRKISPVLRGWRGITLIELTVVVLVLMMLLGFLFLTANAWKKGANRSNCIINIRQVQMGVRSFSNLWGFDSGRDVSAMNPPLVLKDEVIGSDRYVEATPSCPDSGTYVFGGDVIPLVGTLYMTCSLAVTDNHVPRDLSGW